MGGAGDTGDVINLWFLIHTSAPSHKQAEGSGDFGGAFAKVCWKLGPRWGLDVYVDI